MEIPSEFSLSNTTGREKDMKGFEKKSVTVFSPQIWVKQNLNLRNQILYFCGAPKHLVVVSGVLAPGNMLAPQRLHPEKT